MLPTPRPRFSREALTLAKRYAAVPADAQRLVDALGVEQAEVSMRVARQFGLDVRSVAKWVKA